MKAQGEAFEKVVLKLMKDLGIQVDPTIGSGSVKNDGDLLTKDYAIECKTQHENRGKPVKDLRIKIDEFDKIEHQAIPLGKEPIYLLENTSKRRFAVMDLDQFMQLIAKVEQYEKEQEE